MPGQPITRRRVRDVMGGKYDRAAVMVEIASLKHFLGNAKLHDIAALQKSLRINGQYRPIVVRKKTRQVLAGNGTMDAALAEGWTEIWATFIDCDARTAKRINLVDNRSSELAGYDEGALLSLLGSLPELEGTGYSQQDMEDLVNKLGETPDPTSVGTTAGDNSAEWEQQLGVIVMCRDPDHQEAVYTALDDMTNPGCPLEGTELKIVAV